MFIFVLRISNKAILKIFWYHSAILCLIPLSCISFCYLVFQSNILCLIQLPSISLNSFVSQYALFCLSVILCLIRLSCTSFSNSVSHSTILSVPHWALCDYCLIKCANLTFRRNNGHVSNFFIASKGIFLMNL